MTISAPHRLTQISALMLVLWPLAASADEAAALDEVSVTATREARATRDVPQSITVVGKDKIEDARMYNVKDAIQGIPGVLIESKNGGYDARLIIRGAGLKAPYGVREIMVLRDGVPLTDPDSMTRFDWIDTEDIERIEVAKGPGNLYSPGAAGGAIQIFSKSVFDQKANVAKIGFGESGAENYHLRAGGMVNEKNALSFTFSRRTQENNWRYWNAFDSDQASIKHGYQLDSGGTWESELAYTESNIQLPGSMNKAEFEAFQRTGRQVATTDPANPWRNSGRYSKIWFFNSKLEQQFGDWVFKPRVYMNQWRHYHPVTGLINDTDGWTRNFGTDLELQHHHDLGGVKGTLAMGVTARQVSNDDVRKYEYRDTVKNGSGKILYTTSDAEGRLADQQKYRSTMAGVFMQESLQFGPRALLDVGFRFDRAHLSVDGDEFSAYDYSTGKYGPGEGLYAVRKSFNLPAPKVGFSYRISQEVSLYLSAASAYQVPSDSEVSNNPNLNPAKSTNYEVGFKGRAGKWSFDTALYQNTVTDEIVTVRNGSINEYVNAGKTDKKGFEFSGSYEVVKGVEAGVNYAYSDYVFDSFSEPVFDPATKKTKNVVRDGNRLPYVPRDQYGIFAVWKPDAQWRIRVQSNSWGRYYLDNANSETYEGYRWVTNVSASYQTGPHRFTVNGENLFDKRYAAQVSKDTAGKVSYAAASPRLLMFNYSYQF